MRQKIVAGNWKMNKNLNEGLALTSEIVNMAADELPNDVQLVLNPPFIHLAQVQKLLKGQVALGAQNCHHEESGAYTGEVSVSMLKSIPVSYTIVGHSERREYFQEDDALIAKKVDLLLAQGIRPIFCCGEALAIREAGTEEAFVTQQITNSLFHLSPEAFGQIVIAYEPIWAIGTGKTASSAQAQSMHQCIRQHASSKYGENVAQNLSILYGGSCKPSNAAELFAGADVDGGLIGGASLKSRDFIDIAKSFPA